MSVLIMGVSHHTAPIELLERAVLRAGDSRELAHRVQRSGHILESLVLSTCNRLEVIVEAETFHGAVIEIAEALGEATGLSQDELMPHLYVHYDERAVAHLFSLACGLDSMAVGESQILGQLRDALVTGQRDGRLGGSLNPLVQQALRVGKRAHAETTIDQVSRSLVTQGLERAHTVLHGHDLGQARVVVVGAGAMSGLVLTTLERAGAKDVTVVNRTRARAERLAAGNGARAADWAELDPLVGRADLVIACTGALGYVIEPEALALARAQQGHTEAPLVVLDLALPRDIHPDVTRLAGVHLWGLVELSAEQRAHQVEPERSPGAGAGTAQTAVCAVRDLVTAEVAGYLTERRAARLGPTLAALRARASQVVEAEMRRLDQRIPQLPEHDRAEVRRAVERVVDKLLHTPTVRAKQLQSGDYSQVLRELFDLDPRDVAVVAAPPPTGPAARSTSQEARR